MFFSILLALLCLNPAVPIVQGDTSSIQYRARQMPNSPNISSSLSAADILSKGIEALGGEAALRSLKTVSYHAQYVPHAANLFRF